MTGSSPGSRGPAADRGALRVSLVAGAVYDLGLGLFIILLGPRVLAALGYAAPEPVYYFYLSGLALFLLPALYLAAARAVAVDPFRTPVLWARAGGGTLILALTLALHPEAAGIYLAVAAADMGWAAVHAVLWNRGRA